MVGINSLILEVVKSRVDWTTYVVSGVLFESNMKRKLDREKDRRAS